jgi:phosphatidylinositol alpha-mannosyltransferase
MATYLDFETRVAVSQEALSTMHAVFGSDIRDVEIVANGIDVERFSRASRAQNDQPVVVFVGRHEHRKGLEVLLQAFSSDLGARLDVIGTGPEHARLRSEYERRGFIDFLGPVDDQLMASRVASADLLVAPSLAGESFGVVLLEAMAANTAVIASDLPGYRLAAGDAARFVPPGDVFALRDAIRDLLESSKSRDMLVQAGAARARQHSFSSLSARYRELYESSLR